MMKNILQPALTLATAILLLTACAPAPEQEIATELEEPSSINAETIQEQRSALAAEIFTLVATPFADHPDQCRALEFGVNACGGAASWLVYSTDVTDSQTLTQLVNDYNEVDALYKSSVAAVSDCAELQQIQLTVRAGICAATTLAVE
ncbi:hypothetical protein [Aliidiomarina haloalkalitolerans]|uniref:Uncharacterized protein n=1 Tax=Aliidiomarina haloalkalitolerans TaxID=859059 RepID=A0A432VXL9_9GAMM|nr:hypothetical protein [Aliidiomarina haloalkalitolerans]MCL4410261.1 hypothetical protein [Gammaproteobacteria bacterium]RUO21453.1 hypothetical protein CWE06_00920 [Aliidiomarina haloalkalitolerans]